MSHRVELPAVLFIITGFAVGVGYFITIHVNSNTHVFWILSAFLILITILSVIGDYIVYKLLQEGWYK